MLNKWKRFFGTTYYVIEEGKIKYKIIVYHHKIYVEVL